jgi:hypothetical protein
MKDFINGLYNYLKLNHITKIIKLNFCNFLNLIIDVFTDIYNMNRLFSFLIVLLCFATMVDGKSSQKKSSTLYQRRFQDNLDYQIKVCSEDSNYDLPLCVEHRLQKENVALAMAKAEKKRQFFLYCQEHPYELRCIGTSVVTNDLIVITGVLTFMIALYLGS